MWSRKLCDEEVVCSGELSGREEERQWEHQVFVEAESGRLGPGTIGSESVLSG